METTSKRGFHKLAIVLQERALESNFHDNTETERQDVEMSSKSRNANFSEKEILFLAQLGKQYPDTENKGYNNARLTRKNTSWEKNAKTFNTRNPHGNKRDLKATQGCKKRMKIQTKKEFDEHRRESKKTGGGKAPSSPNAVSKIMTDIIPPLRVSN